MVNGCRWSEWLLILRGCSRDGVDFLLVSIIFPTGRILFCGATCPAGGLIEERLLIFYPFGLEVVFYAFPGLDQVDKRCVSVIDEPIIVS